jgi:hypothetical protein
MIIAGFFLVSKIKRNKNKLSGSNKSGNHFGSGGCPGIPSHGFQRTFKFLDLQVYLPDVRKGFAVTDTLVEFVF